MSDAAVDNRLRTVIREELLRAQMPALGETPATQPLADVTAERELLSALMAGHGTADDLTGLELAHFFDRRCATYFELIASPIRGGLFFDQAVIVTTMVRLNLGDEAEIAAWIEGIRSGCPVRLWPTIAAQVKRIRRIAAWRQYFEKLAELETVSRYAFSKGQEFDPAKRCAEITAQLHAELGACS